MKYGTVSQLAEKLSDAGVPYEDGIEWIREITTAVSRSSLAIMRGEILTMPA